MDQTLSIGEFARLTHLPVKTLRHYHQVGVLVPANVDPVTGYRRYHPDQVEPALLARRLRDLSMPLPEVRSVLAAPDEASRNRAILDYLEQMERGLERTLLAVSSLRSLLEEPAVPVAIEHRRVAARASLARRATVDKADIAEWCASTFPLLDEVVAAQGLTTTGPGGALYDRAFFEQSRGQVVAFVPVVTAPEPDRGLVSFQVPAAHLAVAVHAGSFDDLDRTYGALGSAVSEAGLLASGPIREHYLVSPAESADPRDWRTEVCWPIAG